MASQPLLSVVCVTYNHESYIAQAIEGFLMQKTLFPFEIVIGEDCSTDRTREICLEYQKKYPDKIRLFLREKNLGAMENHLGVIESCRSKYLANCEGDDYWTDPLKLQKQVDFLENNPGYAICGHNVKVVYEGTNQAAGEWKRPWSRKEEATIEDVISSGGAATGSLVWRNKIFGEFPGWFREQKAGDWSLQILCTSRGKMKYFSEKMGVYRVHKKGAFGNALEIVKQKNITIEAYLYDSMRNLLDALDAHFAYRYSSLFNIARNYNDLEAFSRYLIAGDFENSKRHAQKIKLVLFKFPLKVVIIFITKLFIINVLPKKYAMSILRVNVNK